MQEKVEKGERREECTPEEMSTHAGSVTQT